MAGKEIREEGDKGNAGTEREDVASAALGPLESFAEILRGVGGDVVDSVTDSRAICVSEVLDAPLSHAPERILKSGGVVLAVLVLIMALTMAPTTGHAADKQVTVTGAVDCGQDTCSVMPAKGSGQTILYFVVKSKAGDKLLKQDKTCSFKPLKMTVLVDAHDNIADVLKVACAK